MLCVFLFNFTSTYSQCTHIVISAYIEGSSNNKCIEIYNPTSSTVDLSACDIDIYANGAAAPSAQISLVGSLAPGAYYLVCNTSVNMTDLGFVDCTPDLLSGSVSFNGDDAIVLECGGGPLDGIGVVGEDPGSQWGTGTCSTADNSLFFDVENACQPWDPTAAAADYTGYLAGAMGCSSSYINSGAQNDGSGLNSCGSSTCPMAGDLIITEIMYDADGTDTGAEWVEVCNTTAVDIDMSGIILSNSGANDHTISGSLIVPANSCIVLASGNLGCGAAATPDYVWADLSGLGNTAGNFELLCGGTTIDMVSWDEAAGWPIPNGGESIQFDLDATQDDMENDLAANWCVSSTICGAGTGTPGVSNTSCNLCMPPAASGSTATTTVTTGAVGSSGDADALDDACIAAQGAAGCGAGETFIPVYGTLSWDGVSGTITGLTQTDGIPYAGVSTFDVFEVIQACAGTGEMGAAIATHGANTTLSNSTTSMQGNSPKPAGIGDHFSENDGSSSDVNQICVDFSVPVDFVSFFLGDVESSDATPGYIHVYDSAGDLITSDPIPTATPIADQATDCTGGTGSAGFDGCGNDETVFAKIESPTASIAKICIEVGDFPDDTASPAGTEHLSFGGVSIGGTCALLPVSWSSFRVQQNGLNSQLEWTTESEINNDYFDVEWSSDGIKFETIGQVKGEGTTSFTSRYEFSHDYPSVGNNYYRLKQVDFDGAYDYSEIKILKFVEDHVVSLRPQLIEQMLTVDVHVEEKGSIAIYNLSGQLVHESIINGRTEVDLSELNPGMFVARLNFQSRSITKRIIKN